AHPPPEISFNYLGQWDTLFARSRRFALARESSGSPHFGEQERACLIEVNALVDEHRLRVDWRFNEPTHSLETITKLAALFTSALRELLEHCRAETGGGLVASDFELSGLSQDELDSILGS